MTTEKALEIYKAAKGSAWDFLTPDNFQEFLSCRKPVQTLQSIATMVENLGGELRSRQLIATIIHFSEN